MAFRSEAHNVTRSGQPFTLNLPAGVANDDILVMSVGVEGNGAITTPSGWTLVSDRTYDAFGDTYHVWTKRAASEPSSYTFTDALTYSGGYILAYNGSNVAANAADNANDRTSPFSADLGSTTNVTNDLTLIYVCWDAHNATSSNITAPSGPTTRLNLGCGVAGKYTMYGGDEDLTSGNLPARSYTSTSVDAGGIGVDRLYNVIRVMAGDAWGWTG